jgi:hypothetical protein
MSKDREQDENLERVTARIGRTIQDFFATPVEEFHADDVRNCVRERVGMVAPGSPDRIMCALSMSDITSPSSTDLPS